jgi:transcriptional regulator GlxA family with amidase domain
VSGSSKPSTASSCKFRDSDCTDPGLTPQRVATRIGCSRASLYRAFAGKSENVAASIWSARIERAHRMVTSTEGMDMLVSDVAAACGFQEMPRNSPEPIAG